jgi:hypothetical protein
MGGNLCSDIILYMGRIYFAVYWTAFWKHCLGTKDDAGRFVDNGLCVELCTSQRIFGTSNQDNERPLLCKHD